MFYKIYSLIHYNLILNKMFAFQTLRWKISNYGFNNRIPSVFKPMVPYHLRSCLILPNPHINLDNAFNPSNQRIFIQPPIKPENNSKSSNENDGLRKHLVKVYGTTVVSTGLTTGISYGLAKLALSGIIPYGLIFNPVLSAPFLATSMFLGFGVFYKDDGDGKQISGPPKSSNITRFVLGTILPGVILAPFFPISYIDAYPMIFLGSIGFGLGYIISNMIHVYKIHTTDPLYFYSGKIFMGMLRNYSKIEESMRFVVNSMIVGGVGGILGVRYLLQYIPKKYAVIPEMLGICLFSRYVSLLETLDIILEYKHTKSPNIPIFSIWNPLCCLGMSLPLFYSIVWCIN